MSISTDRCWKWFLRALKAYNKELATKLEKDCNYVPNKEEKELLKQLFLFTGSFSHIMSYLFR